MAYTTVNGTDASAAVEYAGADGLPEIKQDALLRIAERYVRHFANEPDPVTAEYSEAAADAELLVFDHLANTEGITSSESVGPINTNYVDMDKVKALVVSATADVAGSGGSNTGYAEKIYRR